MEEKKQQNAAEKEAWKAVLKKAAEYCMELEAQALSAHDISDFPLPDAAGEAGVFNKNLKN